jgi:hypothetical protein
MGIDRGTRHLNQLWNAMEVEKVMCIEKIHWWESHFVHISVIASSKIFRVLEVTVDEQWMSKTETHRTRRVPLSTGHPRGSGHQQLRKNGAN